MKMTNKSYEIVYISTVQVPTEQGIALIYLAMDDYSEVVFEPVVSLLPKNEEQIFANLVQFFNNINANYDRTKHAQTTIYVTDYPENLHPFMRSVMMKGDSLVYDPEKTGQAFEPFLETFLKSKG